MALARNFCARKRIQQPAEQKEVVRVMNRLMRAGYSSGAIFKLLRSWKIDLPESGPDSDSYAERDDLPEF